MSAACGVPGPDAQVSGLAFALLLVDPAMIVIEANPACEEMLGRSAPRIVGNPLPELLEIADPRVTARWQEDDAPLVARGVVVNTASGARSVNLTMSPLATHPGWRVVTLSEVGQEEGEPGREPAAVGAPAVLAHEIKNPLAAIRGAAQLIARKLADKDRPLADLIGTEVARIASLVDRMQRIGSRLVEPNMPINLHGSVRRAIATIRAAGLGDTELIERFDPSLPPVLGSEGALEQVVINLLSNARDACADQDNARITIQTRYVSGLIRNAANPGRSIRLPIELTVSDNGPGIASNLRDHVFEPFVSGKKNGQGLGLALVHRLVRDMDGRVSHERDEGAGLTHFRVHLPLTK